MMRSSLVKWVSQLRCPKPSIFAGNGLESPLLNWVSRISSNNQMNSSKLSIFSSIRGFCTQGGILPNETEPDLSDYLHRHVTDGEQTCKDSTMVHTEKEIGSTLPRHSLYHPIDKCELFFGNLAVKPSELNSFLRRELMLVWDDQRMLDNYRVLFNYGIDRSKIGMMYKDAVEIFRYEPGVLDSKLRGYELLGLGKSGIVNIVASAPTLLIGEVNRDFVKVVEELEGVGIERGWIGGVLIEKNVYDWGRMLMVLKLFAEMGFMKQESANLIRRHPDFLLQGSGKAMFSIVALLSKLGGTRSEVHSLFSRFPNIQVGCFQRNLLRGLLFLIEIEMDTGDIAKLLRTRTEVFGMHFLKKTSIILNNLNVEKKQLSQIMKENPHYLEKYVFGVRELEKQPIDKREFLLRLGFADESPEMMKALTAIRAEGDVLQERYDFLVKTGLDPNDVSKMTRTAPRVLNCDTNVLKRKIDFLINNLGYPLVSLAAFPSYIFYAVDRVNHRFLMYQWLKDRGVARQALALSTLVACSDKSFIERYVNRHPEGLQVWKEFQNRLSST